MWLIAFRDLQMRLRRFAIAIVAVGLVFGITLMLDGFDHSLTNDVWRTGCRIRRRLLAESVELVAGDVLFRQGAAGDRVYVVESGVIELVRALSDGREEVLAIAGPREYFGELSPMFQLPRAATARARTDAVLTSYSLRDFRDQLPRLPRSAERPGRSDLTEVGGR